MRVIFYFAILIYGTAFASEPLSLKGLPLGATMAEVKKHYPSADCPGGDKASFCMASFDLSSSRLLGRPNFAESVDALRNELTVAGVNMRTIIFNFHDGALERITMVPSPAAFDRVATALADRYGAPVSDTPSIVRTKAGVEHNNRTMLWKLPGGVIRYTKIAGNINDSSLSYSTHESLERMTQRAVESRKKAASDL